MILDNAHIPILGFAAFSGTGKTTLLSKLLPLLKARGIRVGMLKHAHHSFDIDHPGKDSHTLRHAGAEQMLIASRHRWALMRETPDNSDEPVLDELLQHLDQNSLDLILVEGFKHAPFPKIELYRPAMGKALIHPNDEQIIAIASDMPLVSVSVPQLDLNAPEAICEFIIEHCQLDKPSN